MLGFFLMFIQNKWRGVLHHVVNVHEWALGCCEHGELEPNEDKKWLEPDSAAHKKLRDIVYNTRLLHSFPYYVNFRLVSDNNYPVKPCFCMAAKFKLASKTATYPLAPAILGLGCIWVDTKVTTIKRFEGVCYMFNKKISSISIKLVVI